MLIFRAFMDDDIIALADQMAHHLPARIHPDCDTAKAAAYALAGEVTENSLYVAIVSLDTGRWPGKKVHEEKLPEFYPDLPKLAKRFGMSIGDIYQIALARAVWYCTKHPRLIGAAEAAELLNVSPETVHQWNKRGIIPESWTDPRRGAFWPEATIHGLMEFKNWWVKRATRLKKLQYLDALAATARQVKYEEGDDVQAVHE